MPYAKKSTHAIPYAIHPDVADRVSDLAKNLGNKAANLKELDLLFSAPTSTFKVKIPAICPLGHSLSQAHLNTYAPEWKTLWEAFQKAQGEEKDHLLPEAILQLTLLRTCIINAFTTHLFQDKSLTDYLKTDALLMVRSTGEEDTITVANPGGNKTISAVKPIEADISIAIGNVIASYFSEKSLNQRLKSKANDITALAFMPVLLQHMVGEALDGAKIPSQIVRSGVIFTNPAGIRIQAAPGHGELVVDGLAPVDTFFVTREALIYPEIARKQQRLIPTDQGLQLTKNPKSLQNKATLATPVVLQLAEIGQQIAAHYGVPMDIEFVYAPQDDTIYLVQARPIPLSNIQDIIPSSIPPDKMTYLREEEKKETIEIIRGQVSGTAGNSAQVVTEENQLLIRDTIRQALLDYFNPKNNYTSVKAIIVQELPPDNSHDVAEFNTLSLPVLQIDNTTALSEWVAQKKPVILIDPQRNQIINLQYLVDDQSRAEEELYEKSLLSIGLFTQPVRPLSQMPWNEQLKSTSTKEESSTLGARLRLDPEKEIIRIFKHFKQDPHLPLDKAHPYTQLLECLVLVEAAKENDNNQSALAALNTLRHIFYRQQTKNPLPFFSQFIIACDEVECSLNRYGQLKSISPNLDSVRTEFLDLIAKLRSLINYPGNEKIFSQSLLQSAQERKSNIMAIERQGDESLTPEQLDYLTEFVKLEKLAFTAKLKAQWSKFAKACAKDKEDANVLTHIIQFVVQNKMVTEWMNINFRTLSEPPATIKKTLDALELQYLETIKELEPVQLSVKKELIDSWESRIKTWSDPEQFEILWPAYQKDIEYLLTTFEIDDKKSLLTQKVVLRTLTILTDVMDRTIKSLKGSPAYANELRTLQVGRFALLLEPYHQLMRKTMQAIPDQQYKTWSARIPESMSNLKEEMLAHIKTAYDHHKKNTNESQLRPSGLLSINSAIVGSTASFHRQFVIHEKDLTLEDLFSLMHQNSLSSLSFLGSHESDDTLLHLPDVLQPIVTLLKKNITTFRLLLLSVECDFPWIKIAYNLPMQNHSAQYKIEYNQQSGSLIFYGKIFGLNHNGRMVAIAREATKEGQYFNCKIKKAATYEANAVEFAWEFSTKEIPELTKRLSSILYHYYLLTFSSSFTKNPSDAIIFRHPSAWPQLPDSYFQNPETIRNALDRCIFSDSFFLEEGLRFFLYCLSRGTSFKDVEACHMKHIVKHPVLLQHYLYYIEQDSKLLKTTFHFNYLMQYLDPEQRTAIYKKMKIQLLSMVHNINHYCIVIQYLGIEERMDFIVTMRTECLNFIKTADDFCKALEHCQQVSRTAIYDVMKTELPHMIKEVKDIFNICEYLNAEQRLNICNIILKNNTILNIKSADVLKAVRPYLSFNQKKILGFMEKMPKSLVSEAFVIALIDNDPAKIKTSLMALIQDSKSLSLKAICFWLKGSPSAALVTALVELGPHLKYKIMTALDLTFPEGTPPSSQNFKCVLEKYFRDDGLVKTNKMPPVA